MALIILEDLLTPEDKARMWRDEELTRTDIAATISDYPNAEAVLAYRTALRDWPSTEDFPDTQPEIENGSN
tara:strand:- start:78 stop:290 length:213 start_codon:yes stop_codon:yes gene_type:complete